MRCIFKIWNSVNKGKAYHDGTSYKEFLQLHYAFRICNLQISRTGNTCHQRFARKTLSTVVTSDSFVVWYPGLCSKCHLIHGSFLGNQADLQKEHIQ